MLVIQSKYVGEGIFSNIAQKLIQKSSNSALAKKVINSATSKNFQKAANSALGKQLQKSVLTGVTNATESATQGAFEKLGIPTPTRKRKKKTTSKKAKRGKGEGIIFD